MVTTNNNWNLKSAVEQMTSVVSYPKRCNLWGRADYRGNCDGRLFLGLVVRYGARRVADPMMGSGTTRDVIDWLNTTHGTSIEYWGSDLKEGFNLHAQDLPGQYDLVWIHPPYWTMIRYSKDPADLSTCEDYDAFRERLRVCLRRCYAAVAPGGRLAVLVGDLRRMGTYTCMLKDLMNWEGELGQLKSVIVKAQHNCQSDRKQYPLLQDVPIKHEYCAVFKKPAPYAGSVN